MKTSSGFAVALPAQEMLQRKNQEQAEIMITLESAPQMHQSLVYKNERQN